jgi:uncharacterized protein
MIKTRIIEEEQKVIVSAIINYDHNALVYLFGSRADLNKKGGDIDILILSDILKKKDLIYIENDIFKKIEEQKIDFILDKKDSTNAFIQMIIEKGIILS